VIKFSVLEYQTENWRKPYAEWVKGLKDRTGAAIIRSHVTRMELGHFGNHRPVGDGVWEMKIHFGPGYRVYYLHDGERVVILLCGGDKDTQARDIAQAKNYATDYGRRK
jgi:putative addiction module killer protein